VDNLTCPKVEEQGLAVEDAWTGQDSDSGGRLEGG
jgi:hypothetical protein